MQLRFELITVKEVVSEQFANNITKRLLHEWNEHGWHPSKADVKIWIDGKQLTKINGAEFLTMQALQIMQPWHRGE